MAIGEGRDASLRPRAKFDWTRVTWGRPDSVLCSYCSASIPDDDVPLVMWNSHGYTAQFCERCMQTEWGFRDVDRQPD